MAKIKKKTSKDTITIKDWWTIQNSLVDASLLVQRSVLKFTAEHAHEFADHLLNWSTKEGALFIEDFLNPIGITRNRYDYHRSKHPELQEAHDTAMMRIGSRQRYLALLGRIDAGMTKTTLHNYLHDWKVENKRPERWRKEDKEHQIQMAELRAQENNAAEELLDYLKDKALEIPELDESKRD